MVSSCWHFLLGHLVCSMRYVESLPAFWGWYSTLKYEFRWVGSSILCFFWGEIIVGVGSFKWKHINTILLRHLQLGNRWFYNDSLCCWDPNGQPRSNIRTRYRKQIISQFTDFAWKAEFHSQSVKHERMWRIATSVSKQATTSTFSRIQPKMSILDHQDHGEYTALYTLQLK